MTANYWNPTRNDKGHAGWATTNDRARVLVMVGRANSASRPPTYCMRPSDALEFADALRAAARLADAHLQRMMNDPA